ncbi:MAG TPA: hypothetical protein VHJ78_09570 [Actinomycetota bacterium]|nr:hypothetical protein [Actinomycetota bacterium]
MGKRPQAPSPVATSAGVSRPEKAYFAVVGLSALWIGFWGYFLPAIQKSIPFPIPPLHARFLGAMYLSAAVMLFLGFRHDRWRHIAVVPVMTAVWTTGIFVVSMLHTGLFNFGRVTTWIWFIAYGVYPFGALWLTWVHRDEVFGSREASVLTAGVRAFFLAQGVLLTLLAAALFAVPRTMVDVWPWAITRELAQLYFAPFLSFGLGSLLLSRSPSWRALRTGAVTMTVFAWGVLIASALHRELFSGSERPDQLWFGLFAVASAFLLFVSTRSFRHA